MIIEIEDKLFTKVLSIVKGRNIAVYEELETTLSLNLNPIDILSKARHIKTDRIKESISSTLRELMQSDIRVSKYQVHKSTNIAYPTLNKYYDEILDEVRSEL